MSAESEALPHPVAGCTWEQAVAWARGNPAMRELVLNCYYDDPIEAAAQRFVASEEWAAIQELLDPRRGDKVMELGAGRGIVSWALARHGCEVFAVEPDPSPLVGAAAIRKLAQATGVPMNVVEHRGERLPFDDGEFDLALCRAALHHVGDLGSTLREVHRVLKPGGVFLAIKEHVAESKAELEEFLRIHPLNFLYGGENAYSRERYVRAFVQAGFAPPRVFAPLGHPISWSPQYRLEDVRGRAVDALARRSFKGIASMVFSSERMVRLFGRLSSRRSSTPGESYSFLARKPR